MTWLLITVWKKQAPGTAASWAIHDVEADSEIQIFRSMLASFIWTQVDLNDIFK